MRNALSFITVAACGFLGLAACDGAAPSVTNEGGLLPEPVFSDIELIASDNRTVDVRVFAPGDGCADCPLIIFSHGAYATYDRYDVLLKNWAENGYVIAAPLHVDSEEHPYREQYAPTDALGLRVEDYETVLAALTGGGPSLDALGLDHLSLSGEVVAAGHSYGALIAQVAAGAELHEATGVTLKAATERPRAVVAISPPSETPNFILAEGWRQVGRPMLVITGTDDITPDFIPEWEMHLDSYEAAPAELAYALVFDGMDHYFNGAFGRPTQEGAAAAQSIIRLNKEILDFIEAAQAGNPPSRHDWLLLSRDGVEARTRIEK